TAPPSSQRGSRAMAPHSWPLCNSLEFAALPTAVPCARLHARQLSWEWGLDELSADIELLVSELVTNAVQAATGQSEPTTVALRLSSDHVRVMIEVWDADPRPPVPKELGVAGIPDLEAPGGRGLFIMASLSTRWDWYPTQEPAGKVVWCELRVEPQRRIGISG